MKNRTIVVSILLSATLVVSQQLVWAQEQRQAPMQGRGQGRGGMMMSAEERAKQLKEQLSLSDEQTKKVTTILEESQKKMREMRGSFQGDFDAGRKAMQQMQAKQDSTIEALLNKDQLNKYGELKKQRQQRMQGMQQRRQGN